MCELAAAAVKNALTTKWLGHNYQYLESTSSTNDLLKKQVAGSDSAHLPAGTVLLTDYQSQGRGRFDRRWDAPPGTSLLLSILLRPNWPGVRLSWLTMLAATAIVKTIEKETALPLALKWPNDVVVQQNGMWHKVCGILLEGHVTAEQLLAYAIIGIGINVNIPADFLPHTSQPATSLATAAQRPISRLELLATLLQQIEHLYDQADRGISPQEEWNRRLITIGQRVEVKRSGAEAPLIGMAEGTGEWGQLLVRDDNGQLHGIMAGDVTLRTDGE